MRTAEEIAADMNSYDNNGLIAAWDVSGGNLAWIEDVSGNGRWSEALPTPKNYTASVIVVCGGFLRLPSSACLLQPCRI